MGETKTINLARKTRGEIVKLCPAVIVRLDRTTQYPETPEIKPRSCGVLDRPLSRATTIVVGVATAPNSSS